MKEAIQVNELRKSYGDHAVLKGLTFHVSKGEVFALLGVNGAGKTTALECMEGLRKYDGGSVVADGRMGIQLQSASLPSHIRPMEAVRLFAKWNRVEADRSMLASLGIQELAKKQYADLSTGQKRRLHLALALISDPDIIFLDEPTAGLDVEGRSSLHDQIRKLKAQGKTIVLASHDMAEVESLCDRIAILNGGNLAYLGTVAQLTAKIGKRYAIRITTGRGTETYHSDHIAETLLELLEKLKRQGIAVLDIEIDRGTLEQDFLEIARGMANERVFLWLGFAVEAGYSQQVAAHYLLCRSSPVFCHHGRNFYLHKPGGKSHADSIYDGHGRNHGRVDRAAALPGGGVRKRYQENVQSQWRAVISWAGINGYICVSPSFNDVCNHLRRSPLCL